MPVRKPVQPVRQIVPIKRHITIPLASGKPHNIAESLMPRVKMHVYEMAMTYHVIFMSGQHQIGKSYKYDSVEQVVAILRRAKANLETLNIVGMALAERRACMVELSLTAEQFSRLNC